MVAGAAAIAFNVGATFASRHDLDQQWKAEKSGAKTLPHWERLIGMAQHWISERTLAIAGLIVVPISDLKTALHFQPAAIRGVPGAQQKGEIAIENKMVGAASMFDRNVDLAISGYSLNDVIVTQQLGRTTVNFKGSGDSLVFNGSARLSFADHTSVDIHA